MRIVSGIAIAIALIAGCTFAGDVCKTALGPDVMTSPDGAVKSCSVVGTWAGGNRTFTFSEDGTFTAMLDGTSVVGAWQISGVLGCSAVLHLANGACGSIIGEYGIEIAPSCTTMSLSGQSDDCGTRASELADTQYKKQ
jgi:hypothetical protein